METDGIHVLHVDDDPSITDLAATLLDEFTVTTATDPREVLDRFDPEEFDCVVSDYEMPRLDGLELYRRLEPRFDHDEFPFILFTGRGSESVAAEALNAGVTGYLQKGGTEQYDRLANRIRNAATNYRAQVRVERYETVAEALGYPVYVVDEDGRFRFVNEAFADLTGHDRTEIVGRRPPFIKPEATVERAERELGSVLSDDGPEVARFEVDIERADGSLVRCRDHMGVLPYEGDQFRGSAGILRPLDAPEDATGGGFGGTDEHYRAIVEALDDPVYVLDEEGRFEFVNDAFVDLVGYDRDRIPGSHPSLIKDDDAVATAERQLGRVLSSDGPDDVRFEITIQPKAGDPVPCEDHMGVLPYEGDQFRGSIGVLREIGRRKDREERLRATTARLEALFENSPDMIDVHDADGTIVDANRRLCEALGYAPEELKGRKVWEIDETVDPETARAFWADLDGDDPRKFEGEYRRRDGSTFPVEIHLARLDAADEDRFLAISRDITERTAYERELERRNERLDEFARIVSHDLRNPLNVATSRLELGRAQCDNEHLRRVEQAHGRMETLIDEVLTLARTGESTGTVEPVDLAALVRGCWANVDTAGAALAVETDRTILADESQTGQLLENLFRNAVDHGGDVTITVGDLDGGFYVADDGPGIPPGEREQVFESGYSETEDGTGFGLSIVERIADAHGWSVAVTESDDGGARFEITGVDAA
ncbi:hybrid sensor histidine kinase/response regulator [Halobacteriales archaeon QS_1_68_17]|nr:MAG: hybrid sensor histidine kinase/response regulator [Halobacteriales archaeon QS_1_68_17]